MSEAENDLRLVPVTLLLEHMRAFQYAMDRCLDTLRGKRVTDLDEAIEAAKGAAKRLSDYADAQSST